MEESLLSQVSQQNAIPTKSKPSPSKHVRLHSLDVVRGITIAVMILVDEIGAAYPVVNHSPWNNITFADFVMPWFLFMVGTSASFSLRKFKQDNASRWRGTRYVTIRAFKLFGLGVLLQGGGWFGDPGFQMYGYNLSMIRWCGILNRIGYAYFFVGLIEIWISEIDIVHPKLKNNPHITVFVQHGKKWGIAGIFVLLHLVLTFATYVPSWTSEWGHNATVNSVSSVLLNEPFLVECNKKGYATTLTPECSAAGYYDRILFGQNHLGNWMSTRLPECSSCSPGQPDRYRPTCKYKYDGPKWCFANIYDPEGALATIPTVMSAFLGTHYGRVLKHTIHSNGARFQPTSIIKHWSLLSGVLIALGLLVHFTFFKMNKQLWSTSYLFFMAGTCGACLTVVYALIDAPPARSMNAAQFRHGSGPPLSSSLSPKWSSTIKTFFSPMQYMGMNAILIFFWHGTAESLLDVLYVQQPKIGGGYESEIKGYLFGEGDGWFNSVVLGSMMNPNAAQLVYVLLKIGLYSIAMWYCYRIGYFWKI